MPDIPIPLVGSSNPGVHPKADCQRSINLIPYKVEREGEKVRWHLVGAPGLELFVTLPNTPIRGMYVFDGRLFAVGGPTVYEIYEDGTTNDWGTLSSVDGKVTIAELNGIIVIGDGAGFYALDLDADTLTAIAAAPVGRHCFAFNQRIHYVQRDSGQVFYSELLDATDVPGLNFYTAENLPDDIVAALATEERIYLFGLSSTEPWYDSGDLENPFQRTPGGVVHSGCAAEDTVVQLDNTVWWVERDRRGKGIVRRFDGTTPIRVSTAAVERFTETATYLTAFPYQEQGHTYYVLNADEGSWAFDLATQEWHERAWRDETTGELKRARPEICAFAFGGQYVSDWENGKVYRMGMDLYSDAGVEQVRRRITGHVDLGGSNVTVDELWVDVATGVGLASGQGSDPALMLRYSTDGGQNWSNELQETIGAIGVTTARVFFNRLGAGRDWAFEISVSDPVQVVLLQAMARVRVGRR